MVGVRIRMPSSRSMCGALRGRRRSTVETPRSAKRSRAAEATVLSDWMPERRLVEPRAEGLALSRRTVALEANLGMVGDIPEPLHVTRVAFVVRFLNTKHEIIHSKCARSLTKKMSARASAFAIPSVTRWMRWDGGLAPPHRCSRRNYEASARCKNLQKNAAG